MRTQRNIEQGFTIIELLIATSVFSVILMLASSAVVQIGRLYYKGLTTTKTQEAARTVMESVSRDLQLSDANGLSSHPTQPVGAYCIGSNRYTYNMGSQVKGTNHGLILDNAVSGSCNPAITGQELLGANMRLTRFSVVSPDGNKTYQINVGVAYGDSDLLTTYSLDGTTLVSPIGDTLCRIGIAGSNFCATSILDTTVKRRIN